MLRFSVGSPFLKYTGAALAPLSMSFCLALSGCSQQASVKPPPVVVTESDWKKDMEDNLQNAYKEIDEDKSRSAEAKTKDKAMVKKIHEQRMEDFERELKRGS